MPPTTTSWALRRVSVKDVTMAKGSGDKNELHQDATRAGVSTRPSRSGSSPSAASSWPISSVTRLLSTGLSAAVPGCVGTAAL